MTAARVRRSGAASPGAEATSDPKQHGSPRTALAAVLGVLLALVTVGFGAQPAWAADARISDVRPAEGVVRFALSAEGLSEGQTIEPDSVRVTIAGLDAPTTAAPIGDAPAPPKRTVLLTLDSSGSMGEEGRLATAKQAALAYLEGLPADVEAGLVAFADTAELKVAPTKNRARVARAIRALKASGDTALYDAVALSVRTLGTQGTRNIVLLSDGQDKGSKTTAQQAIRQVRASGVVLDAVSLGTGRQEAQLAALAAAGGGSKVTATDAAGLVEAFESAARTVDTQLAVESTIPAGVSPGTVALTVTASVGTQTISDSAAALIEAASTQPDLSAYGPQPVAERAPGIVGQTWFLLLTVALVFVGLLLIAALAVDALDVKNRRRGRIARRLDEVSVAGAPPPPSSEPNGTSDTVLGDSATVRLAVSFADRVAATRGPFLARRLEAANVALRPGEWVVVHALVAVLACLLSTLLTNFNLLFAALALVLGLVLPWFYLTNRAERRSKRFYESLPDSMQMLAGSLSAGYSLPQGLENVAREAGGPMSEELNRALLESRLGMPLEEALEAAAQRTQSDDFHWVVMAIRINRQVGGNLAEVLTTVSRTIRERERLRRQVKALSAEGVLSAWILGVLPIAIGAFVALTRPSYLTPLFTTQMGLIMMVGGLILYVVGIVWMRNLVRMDV